MNFVSLPFELPETEQAQAWLDELDYVDPWEGGIDELRSLGERAPTPEIGVWLERFIEQRSSLVPTSEGQ